MDVNLKIDQKDFAKMLWRGLSPPERRITSLPLDESDERIERTSTTVRAGINPAAT
jgi:hypothetical protein